MDPSTSQSEVPGMECVVATVSGYHGTERFRLIKLIARTGASYVGAMGRSTTHLVCWKFEGKKYDLARQLGTQIVSHRWFEDCLKEGRRLPEDPYSMQNGIEAGPISWQLPVVLDRHDNQKSVSSSKRILSDQSNALDFRRQEDKDDATCFQVVDLEWSDSNLFDENYSGLNNRMKGSKNSKRSTKVRKHEYGSNNKGNPTQPANSHDDGPKSRFYSRNKRNLCDASGSDDTSATTRRSRRLQKKNAPAYPLNPVMLDCNLTENYDARKANNHVSIDLDNFRNRMVPTSQETIASEELPVILRESRRQTSLQNNDIGENTHVSKNSNSPSCNSVSVSETLQNEYCEDIQEVPDFCSVGGDQNGEREKGDEQGKLAAQPSETNLSCVICWTDNCSTRGILPCGHRFCYSCIHEWADCMNSRGKVSTCPLCKTGFSHIIKWEETTSSDQKIYSQSVPCNPLRTDCLMAPVTDYNHDSLLPDSLCYHCHNREPEDLLVCCHICHNQWVHSYCLDPPLVPWTCLRCTDLRLLYQRFH